jgi:hypothetical protein
MGEVLTLIWLAVLTVGVLCLAGFGFFFSSSLKLFERSKPSSEALEAALESLRSERRAFGREWEEWHLKLRSALGRLDKREARQRARETPEDESRAAANGPPDDPAGISPAALFSGRYNGS